MATIKWAVTTFGTFDFNDPANWQFGTVPGALDIAQFDQNFANIVTGDARIAELLVTQGLIDVTGSYTISGAQSTELAVSSGGAALFIEPGASISGTGNISVGSGSGLVVRGTLSGGSATFTNAQFTLQPGSIFDVGTVNLGSGDIIHGSLNGFTVTNAIQNGNAREALRQLALALDAGAVSYQILGQLAWFVRDRMTDTRRIPKAVDALLNGPRYADNWSNYWNTVLMGRQVRSQLVDPMAFRKWLHAQFENNTPWNKFVFDLITAKGQECVFRADCK